MSAILNLFRRRRPAQPRRVPVEAAFVFAQAVHLAKRPILEERDERELARLLQNYQTLISQ